MASLTNITVDTTSLEKFQPDIQQYLFNGASNFTDEITLAKDRIHRKIQDTRALTDEQMADIKDAPTNNLVAIVSMETISDIFLANGMVDRAELWSKKAKETPLAYYIDEDDDDVVAEGEKDYRPNVKFGR